MSPQLQYKVREFLVMSGFALLQNPVGLIADLSTLIMQPGTHTNSFLPTMPQSSFFDVQGAAAVHNTRVYQCRNGHQYVIGECLRPMEQSQCPDCGAPIGGTDHRLLADNRQGDITEASQAGYHIPPSNQRGDAVPERDLTKLSVSALRILLHTALLLGCKRNQINAIQR